MTPRSEQILREVLSLAPMERVELVERILASLEFPACKDVDAALAQEAEDRIDAFERGVIASSPANQVFKEIDQRARG